MEGRKWCYDCCTYEVDRTGKDKKTFAPAHTYCKQCRVKNATEIKHRIELDAFKAALIRNELLANPSLEMDLLCNMPRRAALDTLTADINKLEPYDRSKWCLFVFDLDFLKCWNTCLGHVKTDILIKKIGEIMKGYVSDINKGMWKKSGKGFLRQAFVYRIVHCFFVYTFVCEDKICFQNI